MSSTIQPSPVSRPAPYGDDRRTPAQRLLKPRSILVAGVSARAGTLGRRVFENLMNSGYNGEVHLLGRQAVTIDGIECVTTVDELPHGIDLALLTVPSANLAAMVDACAEHEVSTAVCYASGFAELGEEGRRQEAELARRARQGGLGLVGPNCFGFLNMVDGLSVLLAAIPPMPAPGPGTGPGVGIVAQSGGMGGFLGNSLGGRGVPISYVVTTGNEVGLGIPEFIEFFTDDPHTGCIAIYAEQIREPQHFTAAVAAATAKNVPVVLMHPGRSARGQAALLSHTGALATDHAVMTAVVRRAGAAVVGSIEELVDLSHLLLRYPEPPTRGLGVVTQSGAVCAIATDAAAALGLDLPALTPGVGEELQDALPFTRVQNPLDLGTQPVESPHILGMAAGRLLDDPAVGSVIVSSPDAGERLDSAWLAGFLPVMARSAKPVIYVNQNEGPPPPGFGGRVVEHRVLFHRSPERALRTLARATELGRDRAIGHTPDEPVVIDVGQVPRGTLPEWLGKQVLRGIGIAVPDGSLARDPDQAVAIADALGYPVVAKAQAAALPHKSDVGGVIVGIADARQLRGAWQRLYANVAQAQPGLALDGILIETMSRPGVELVVGARRDPRWGPVVLVGSGGVLVEALDDVRLMPADLPEPAIRDEISRLKGAKVLHGFRGAPPADIAAVAEVAARIGQLMRGNPQITEVDVNPLVIYPQGSGAVALDALVVVGQRSDQTGSMAAHSS